MAIWIGAQDGPDMRLRVWAQALGKAGFTLRDGVTGDIIPPDETLADSASYVLSANQDWALELIATGSYSDSGDVKIWHEVQQPEGDTLPCLEIPVGIPINGPPFDPVKLGEVAVGMGKTFVFQILVES